MQEAPSGPPAPDADGNYVSPSLAAIRGVWSLFQQEQATLEEVMAVLRQVAVFVHYELATLAEQAETGVSDPQNPIYQTTVDAFRKHLEALDVMGAALGEEAVAEGFQRGLDLAQEATNQMMHAHHQMMEHLEAMGRFSCMFCGQETPRGMERCQHCGRVLPAAPGEPEKTSFSAVNLEGLESGIPRGAEVTANYVQVAGAVQAWRNEQIDADQLLAVLEEVEQLTRAHQQECSQHRELIRQAPEEAQAALTDGVAMTEAGLDGCLAALEKMKLAFLKEDDSYLETGLHDLEGASRLMVQAFHASRAAAAAASQG
ncbi:MAG: hypothetical protein AB1758_16950 [Candidatus Eremiobacterota bacterium]